MDRIISVFFHMSPWAYQIRPREPRQAVWPL